MELIGVDTAVCFSISQSRVIASDLAQYQVVDSLLSEYEKKDSISDKLITKQKDLIAGKDLEINIYKSREEDFKRIISNKDQEVEDLNKVIGNQKKQIRKLKVQKFIGFSLAVLIPTAILYLQATSD